jgi:hypothetical protein
MSDPKNPKVGDRSFEGEEFTYLVELPPGGLQGRRTAQERCDEVCKEILANQPQWGAKAGVTAEDASELELINARIARIDQFLQPVRKFLDLLVDTRYVLDDQRQKLIFNVAQSVDRRGKALPSLLGAYALTREYRSAIAKKAAKTRQKNAEESSPEQVTPKQGAPN